MHRTVRRRQQRSPMGSAHASRGRHRPRKLGASPIRQPVRPTLKCPASPYKGARLPARPHTTPHTCRRRRRAGLASQVGRHVARRPDRLLRERRRCCRAAAAAARGAAGRGAGGARRARALRPVLKRAWTHAGAVARCGVNCYTGQGNTEYYRQAGWHSAAQWSALAAAWHQCNSWTRLHALHAEARAPNRAHTRTRRRRQPARLQQHVAPLPRQQRAVILEHLRAGSPATSSEL